MPSDDEMMKKAFRLLEKLTDGRTWNRLRRRALRDEFAEEQERATRGRPCGTCSACCTAVAVRSLSKHAGTPCKQQAPEGGCGIYAKRPNECRNFFCLWRAGVLGPGDRPDVYGVVLVAQSESGILYVNAMEYLEGAARARAQELEDLAYEIGMPIVAGRGGPGMREMIAVGPDHLVTALLAAKRRHLPIVQP